jgi:hypothetical protein
VESVEPEVFVQVNDVLCRFFLCFDQRDWPSMVDCLGSEVAIDYVSSGRERPTTMTGRDFVSRRQNAADTLAKHHSFSNLLITPGPDAGIVRARCNYLILRFDLSQERPDSGEDFFHSCGGYEFELSDLEGEWKISGIKQDALRSWGNASLHGGSAKANG